MKVRYPERVVYPVAGFRKRDVIDYYDRISSALLPHLRSRPVTLKRYPDQAQGEFFYEKDAPGFTPKWVKTFPVWRRSGESQIHYIVISDKRTLLWAASVGTLEIHPFLARAPEFDSPTEVVFDLDPGEGADILTCAEVAFRLRELLARLGLESFAKVSGSKGLQVYAPLNTPATYAATQPFARTVAEMLEREHPRGITAVMEKAQRKNKVFIDWSQNADYKTTVSVYSLRAKRRHPYVSAPVAWEELERATRDRNAGLLYFLPDAAIERVRKEGDLFAPVETIEQMLPETFLRGLHITPASPKKQSKGTTRGGGLRESARASEQGGRRTFTAVTAKNGTTVSLQLHERMRAWRVRKFPSAIGEKVPAEVVDAIRAREVSDSGTVELIEGNAAKGYLDLWFSGQRLKGEVVLRGNGEWEMIRPKAGEEYAPAAFVQHAKNGSHEGHQGEREHAKSRLRGEKTGARLQPRFVPPMECLLVKTVPNGDDWLYELKLDGYRIVAVKKGAKAILYSRRGTPFSDRFPQITAALRESALPDCVLDGEIVALDQQGRPSFQELQNSRATSAHIVYYVFDLLFLDGRDLQREALGARKQMLNELSKEFLEPVRLAQVITSNAATLVAEVKRLGLEGVVAKRVDSIYESSRRSGAWVKYRVNEREEFVIGGYLPGRTGLDALLVGRQGKGSLYFVKKVRTGFVPQSRREVLKQIAPLKIKQCPFVNLPEPSSRRGAVDEEEMRQCVWVRPERMAEIEYAEQTAGGRLRHADFRQIVES